MSNSNLFGSPMVLPGIRPASPFGAAVKPSLRGRVLHSLKDLAARTFGPLFRDLRVRRTVLELSKLDDHMLRDIGLNRSSIVSRAQATEERLHGRSESMRI
ncbi:DUF1127 domain-containing protein [Pelagibius sp.]|uniref:DUF1127 domain-containing protein n=1 Tax=Pelagibius sp. TaxID=1931238 RepID=UPI003BB1C736